MEAVGGAALRAQQVASDRCACDQRARVAVRPASDGDADARGQRQRPSGVHDAPLQRVEQRARGAGGGRAVAVEQEHSELAAAAAREHVRRIERGGRDPRHLTHDRLGGLRPEALRELIEAVEVDQQHGRRACAVAERGLQPLLESLATGEPGQWITLGHVDLLDSPHALTIERPRGAPERQSWSNGCAFEGGESRRRRRGGTTATTPPRRHRGWRRPGVAGRSREPRACARSAARRPRRS